MKRAALLLAVLLAVSVTGVLVTGSRSIVRDGSYSLVVGNVLRASDLTDAGTISGKLTLNPDGCLSIDGVVLMAPGGSRLDEGGLVVSGKRFELGDTVELEGGHTTVQECGASDAIFFWKIRPAD